MNGLPVITRPNGKPYRPQRIVAFAIEGNCGDGVLVLGTHDLTRAQALADKLARDLAGAPAVAADPVTGWYRDGMECGERRWVHDEVRGRAGVWFRDIEETS